MHRISDLNDSATITTAWEYVGVVSLKNERPHFPVLPPVPGVYAFALGPTKGPLTVYVGETDNLNRRMAGYRNPGPTQATNKRMNQRIVSTVSDGGSVTVEILRTAHINSERLDLSTTAVRRLVENFTLVRLGAAGRAVENL